MNGWKTWLGLAVLTLGCGDGPKQMFSSYSGTVDSGVTTDDADADVDADVDADADADADVDIGPDDSAEPVDDTGEEGSEAFDNPGDTRTMEQGDDGSLEMDLTDASGDSNQEHEFYLVLVNTGSDEATYTLRYIPTMEEDEEDEDGPAPDGADEGPLPMVVKAHPDGGEGPPPDGGDGPPPDEGGSPGGLTAADTTGHSVMFKPGPASGSPHGAAKATPLSLSSKPDVVSGFETSVAKTAMSPPPPSDSGLDESAIGFERRVFRVRRDLNDSDECEIIDATLWALGDYAAIWVDGDLPIDQYRDCSDTELCEETDGCFEESDYEAHGFDNCDLETIVNIVDTNIMPNVTALLGDTSDEDENGRVSIVISPVLNTISLTSDEEDDWASLVEAYTDPETDLGEYSEEENPCSDEQEVIYVYAPDPYGYYNPHATVTVDEYTGMDLAGRIVQGMVGLISYNQHVLVNESDAEEGLGSPKASLPLWPISSGLAPFTTMMPGIIWMPLISVHSRMARKKKPSAVRMTRSARR